jgi:Epoxide hydrolase N terminus
MARRGTRLGWQYGSSRDFVRRLVEHWRCGFDWRKQESRLNTVDQFRVAIGGIDLHFVHQRGVGPDPLPLDDITAFFRSLRGR